MIHKGQLALQAISAALLRVAPIVALGAVLVGLAAAWGISYAMGGSRTAGPHLFYIPIVIAAVRVGWIGALATAVAAGLLAGPVLPADVDLGIAQPVEGWSLRLPMFVAIGALVAWLNRGQLVPLAAQLDDALTSGRLLRGLRQGEVEVYYQPIVETSSGRIVGLEALARWTGSAHGTTSPDQFIPKAERTGAIAALDRFVLREAARQAQCWSSRIAPVDMSVNVSATRFAQHDLVPEVERVLRQTGLDPCVLQIEITESAIIEDTQAACRQIAQLRALGVRVAIDDFGAGQSSLSYLDEFAVDTIKIDRSMLSRTAGHPHSEKLFRGIVDMFCCLGLRIVAEGVETAEQVAYLRSTGCHYMQGYHLGRPSSQTEIEAMLGRPASADVTANAADTSTKTEAQLIIPGQETRA